MSLPSRAAPFLVGMALLSVLTIRADAQTTMVPMVHRRAAVRTVDPAVTGGAEVVSGVSLNYTVPGAPAGGSAWSTSGVLPDGFTALTQLSSWFSAGPTPLLNAGGTYGGASTKVSGRVAGIAGDPTNASIFYVAAAGGGIWKTVDGGVTYVPLTDGLPDAAMGAVAVAPSAPNVVYAGTGEANFSGDSRYGIGLLKSTDGGATWTVIPGPSNVFYRGAISKIVVSPADPNVVYLTTTFASYDIGGSYGVWKTTNGGTSWTNMTAAAGLSSLYGFTDLAMDRSDPSSQTLYAALGYIFGASVGGVYKTTNGGATWSLVGSTLPSGSDVGRIALAVGPPTGTSASGTVYASLGYSASATTPYYFYGLYKSTDGGATWTKLSPPDYLGGTGSSAAHQSWYDNVVAVSPADPNYVIAGGVVNYTNAFTLSNPLGRLDAIVCSVDGGTTWYDLSVGKSYLGPHTDHHALAFDANGRVLNGNDGGVWRLENLFSAANPPQQPTNYSGSDGNIQWTTLNAGLGTIQFTGIALHPTDPNTAYGGSQDNGSEKFTGSPGWSQLAGGDGGFMRVDQTNPLTVYHTYTGISLYRSDDGGASFSEKISGINQADNIGGDASGGNPVDFYMPYILDPANQSRVILGTDRVYVSTNRGDSFSSISTPNTNGFNPNDKPIDALAVNGNAFYISLGGSVFRTLDGTAWADVTPSGTTGNTIPDVYVNPNTPKDAYVVAAGFGGGHVFRTTDGGSTWSNITGNLPDQPYNAIKVDKASGTIYVGGDDGVYYSSDYGTTWARLGTGMPFVQVVDLAISPGAGILGAGTHGRGLWEYPLFTTAASQNVIANATLAAGSTSGQRVATVTVRDVGTADALNVQITGVTLNGVSGTPSGGSYPVSVGTPNVVPAYAQSAAGTFTVDFGSTPPASGTRVILRVYGTTTAGSFLTSLRLTAP